MSILGKEFTVKDISKLGDFPIRVGDTVKVLGEFKSDCYGYGATFIEVYRNGDVTRLDISGFSGYWCFFSRNMIINGELIEIKFDFDDPEPNIGGPCTLREVKMSGIPHIEADVKGLMQSVVNNMNIDLMLTLEERYNNWVVENIHVYEMFCEFAIKAIQSGKKKISHWLIVNRLRWEVEIETKGTCYQDKDFKISNDYIAFLARDFMKDYPQYGEVFTIKQMKRV